MKHVVRFMLEGTREFDIDADSDEELDAAIEEIEIELSLETGCNVMFMDVEEAG